MFMFFLLFAACFAAEQTYTIGAKGELVIKIDKDQLKDKIINKCGNAEFFRFMITEDSEKLKFNIYTTVDCTGNAVVSIDMTEIAKNLPPIQEEIKVNGDVTVTLGMPYGCLLKYLPEITGDVKGAFNYEFVHTQFGADIHMYQTEKGKNVEECKGIDTIVQFFNDGQVISETVKMKLAEAKVSIENMEFGKGAINMFETIKKELYEYKDKIPKISELQLDEYIYEFNGTVMKIYQYVEQEFNGVATKVIKYVEDAVIPKAEEIIGKLVKEGKEFSITAECDPLSGNSFGYYDGKLQMTTANDCNFNVNGFNLNFRLNISAILGKENKITINDEEYTFEELGNYAKDLKTQAVAIIESFGSNMEFELNTCKPISILDVMDTFTELAEQTFGNLPIVGDKIMEAIQKGENIKKYVEEQLENIKKVIPNFELPTYYYKVSMLKTGNEGKNFATYAFYEPSQKTCEGEPLFEFVIGVVKDIDIKDVETGFELIRYLDKENCAAKQGKDGYYKEHVEIDTCVNGYQFKYENDELKMVACDNKKQTTVNDDTAYKCETCVECQKKAAMSGDYAYVTCGTSSIFMLLVALIFFILF